MVEKIELTKNKDTGLWDAMVLYENGGYAGVRGRDLKNALEFCEAHACKMGGYTIMEMKAL